MGLKYIYIIYSTHAEGIPPMLMWAGCQKWGATEYLKGELEKGVSLAGFKVTRLKESEPNTITEVDVYEFMNIDLGETF